MGRTHEACRTRSRGAGSDISSGLEGLLVLAAERAWEGHPRASRRRGHRAGGGPGGADWTWGLGSGTEAVLCGIRHGSRRGSSRPAWDVRTVTRRQWTASLALAFHPPACQVACRSSLSEPTFRRRLSLNIWHQPFYKLAALSPGSECRQRSPVAGNLAVILDSSLSRQVPSTFCARCPT